LSLRASAHTGVAIRILQSFAPLSAAGERIPTSGFALLGMTSVFEGAV